MFNRTGVFASVKPQVAGGKAERVLEHVQTKHPTAGRPAESATSNQMADCRVLGLLGSDRNVPVEMLPIQMFLSGRNGGFCVCWRMNRRTFRFGGFVCVVQ